MTDVLVDELRSQMAGFTADVVPSPDLVQQVHRRAHRRRVRLVSAGVGLLAAGAVTAVVAVYGGGAISADKGPSERATRPDALVPADTGDLSQGRTLSWRPTAPEDLPPLTPALADREPWRTDAHDLALARQLLFARCMSRAGFSQPLPPVSADYPLYVSGSRYALRSPAFAREHGYDQPEPYDDPTLYLLPDVLTWDEAERAAWQAAASDTDDEGGPRGCLSTSGAELGLTPAQDAAPSRLEELDHDLHEAVVSDPNFAAAEARWTTCMAGAGYPGMELLLAKDVLFPSRQAEVEQVVTDADCQVSSGLWSVASQLQALAVARLERLQGDTLARLDAAHHEAGDRARAVLTTG
jgi:hypothetical protein